MRVGRLFWLAVIMTAAIIVTWEVIIEVVTTTATAKAGAAHAVSGFSATIAVHAIHGSWRVPIIAISASIMVLVIATGAALLRLAGVKPTPSPPPIGAALAPEALADGHAPPLPSPRHARPGSP